MNDEESLMTTLDASRRLDCSPENVRVLAKQGKLPTVLTVGGRQRLYRAEDVEQLRQERARRKDAR